MTAVGEDDLVVRWARRELPAVDAVVRPGGRVTLLRVSRYHRSEDGVLDEIAVRPVADTTAASLEHYEARIWVRVGETARLELPEKGLSVCCGGGALGDDGFVALEGIGGGALRWAVFLEGSNPFVALEASSGGFIATTTLGHRWCFSWDAPEHVEVDVTCASPPCIGS